jgi:DNA polymerase-3 subunit gamma/tau
MSYLVLARRFRPQSFQDIVGQEHVTRTLENAISSNRVAHAFLFAGARGVGKTTSARVLAKALNCVHGPTTTPCGVCDQCESIAAGRSVDVQEIDGASNNSVEDVRALRETVPYRPASGRFKVYIVDEVHMLTTSAFNALLKTLEEPPDHVKFVFATTEAHKIPITILSRCQRYDFRLVHASLIRQRLAEIVASEDVACDDVALSLLAREAQGSMRDALSLLDQALAFNAEHLKGQEVARLLGAADRQSLLEISRALLSQDPAAALRAVEAAASVGCDLSRLCYDLLAHLRNVVVVAQCPSDRDLVDLSDEEHQEVTSQVKDRPLAELHRFFLLFAKATEEIARSPQPRLLLEMTLARLASLEPMRSLELLAQQLEGLASAGPGRLPPGVPGPANRGPAPRGKGAAAASVVVTTTAPGGGAAGSAAGAAGQASEFAAYVPRRGSGASPGRPPPRPSAPSVPSAPPRAQREAPAQAQRTPDWKALLEHIQRSSPPSYHVLRYAQPMKVTAEGLELALPDEPFFQAQAKNPQCAKAVQQASEALYGHAVEVDFTVAASDGPSIAERAHIENAAREQDRKREALEHTAVRAALNEFEGARIKKIRLFDGRKK